ncbi:6702_t:CDS:2 [Funneliformis mosseae]|uniref:6702_t:CDS:1 n=1 Tax=Funneliformis mosseae TaxID=27381 RepID=A0A9N9AZC8_FUNMO|nr:6702_t:CDS:2 [Funneliformis mosseae]
MDYLSPDRKVQFKMSHTHDILNRIMHLHVIMPDLPVTNSYATNSNSRRVKKLSPPDIYKRWGNRTVLYVCLDDELRQMPTGLNYEPIFGHIL